jgi:uncharacterized protein involved in exopolysaccharide biosynthesis/Mrp family chromosome partitioning ATPase
LTQIDRITRALAVAPAPLAPAASDDWLDVQSLYRMVRRRIGLIVVVGLLVLLAALPLVLGLERTYAAGARILIREPLPAALTPLLFTAEQELDLSTEGERLLSRTISARVISELGLATRAEFNPALAEPSALERLKDWARDLARGGEAPAAPTADRTSLIVQAYLGHLTIARPAGSEVVSIAFRSLDPELAASVPNTLIRVYLEERERQAAELLARAETWLARRVEEQRGRLERAQAALDAFRTESEFTLLSGRGAAETVAELDERHVDILGERADLSARLSALEEAGDVEERMAAADVEAAYRLGRELAAERRTLDALLARYGAAHGDVVASRERISGLESSIEAEIDRQRRRLLVDRAALDREEAEILAQVRTAREGLAAERQIDDRQAQLQRTVQSEQDALSRLGEQQRALHAEADLPPAEIEVLSPASVPLSAEGHGRSYYLAAALFAAGALSLTLAFLVEMLDRSVRSHDQLAFIPGITPAGLIPRVSSRVLRGAPGPRRQRSTQLWRDSLEALILTLEQRPNGLFPQSLLVTSALAREGKSEAAAALAVGLVATGREVLLVDADQDGGRLHERFGVPAVPGLADYLAGEAPLADVIRRDEVTGVSFIPRGSDRVRRDHDRHLTKALLSAAAAARQVVIFDATPALLANESLQLAGASARTLLVVRWGRTSRGAVEAAAERLSLRGARDIHVVLNRVDLRRQALYGYRDAGELARSLRLRYAAPWLGR